MSELVLAALILTPVILSVLGSVLVWRHVVRPWLYLVISLLALLGVQAIVAPVAVVALFVPKLGGVNAVVDRSVVVSAACVVVFGVPLLWWLYKGLRRA